MGLSSFQKAESVNFRIFPTEIPQNYSNTFKMESASDPIKLHYSRLIDLLETEPELILLVSNRLILINPIEIAKKYNSEEDKHTATVDNLIELLKDNGWVDISDMLESFELKLKIEQQFLFFFS